jgi:hypothetical protein
MKEVLAGTRDGDGETPQVRIKDVQTASRENAMDAMYQAAIATVTPLEGLLLISLGALIRNTGRIEVDIVELMTKMDALASGSGDNQYMPAPNFDEVLYMLTNLAEGSLLKLQTPKSSKTTFQASLGGSGGAWPMISLGYDWTDLRKAFKNTVHKDLAEKHLSPQF